MRLQLLLLGAVFYGCVGAEQPAPLVPRASQPQASAGLLAPAPRLSRDTRPSVRFTLATSQPTLNADGRLQFWLVAVLTPPPQAHLFWKHAGETGLPTNVKFFVPSGFELSATQYPGPHRFRAETGRVGYGYTGTVAIMAEVVAPKSTQGAVGTAPAGVATQVRFEALGSWLSCDELCIKEQARAHITWPPATGQTVAQDTLQTWLALLPGRPDSDAWQALAFDPHSLIVRAPSSWTIVEVFPEQDFEPNQRDLASAAPEGNVPSHQAEYRVSQVPASVVVKAQSEQLARYVRLKVSNPTAQ